MTIFKYELKRNKISFFIWTISIVLIMLMCVALFPEMKSQSQMIEQVYSQLGGMTEAFGMDRISMADAMGFYGIECGNMLGIGGAFFAAIIGIAALLGEEKNRTAEFLLTHPVSRTKIVAQKLIAIIVQIFALNMICALASYIGFMAIGEKIDIKTYVLFHIAYFIMQIEIAAICFGISACMKGGSIGVGIGIAAFSYIINIVANLSDKVDFLKYITPYGYAEPADIITKAEIDTTKLIIGLFVTVCMLMFAFVTYNKKDINA